MHYFDEFELDIQKATTTVFYQASIAPRQSTPFSCANFVCSPTWNSPSALGNCSPGTFTRSMSYCICSFDDEVNLQ